MYYNVEQGYANENHSRRIKGRRLKTPEDNRVRPTADKVKRSGIQYDFTVDL